MASRHDPADRATSGPLVPDPPPATPRIGPRMSVTRHLARMIVAAAPAKVPPDVRHEARRALVNYVGCALGGSRHPAMDIAIRTLAPFSGSQRVGIIGRAERLDALNAALMNGISSHVLDYDDTIPKNYVHATTTIASALFGFAGVNRVPGVDFAHAFVIGFEVTSKIANAVFPQHYDRGWHSTGAIGVFGAAAAIGKLISLTEDQMVSALGIAATQSANLRETFGSMAKALHPGRAAQNGYTAAMLAGNGLTGPEQGLEGPHGFAMVQAGVADWTRLTDAWGTEYDLRVNAYKPFPCGIVVHPVIDAAIQLRAEHAIVADEIAALTIHVGPRVLDLCNRQEIATGLETKFSAAHGAAIGLVRGRGGPAEFTDEAVHDARLKALRELAVVVADDPTITEANAQIDVTLRDGRRLSKRVEHALGSVEKPLSDAQLDEKFRDQAIPILGAAKAERLRELCWRIDEVTDANVVLDAAVVTA
jgi:2-methylcitrate dehydratase PrpD